MSFVTCLTSVDYLSFRRWKSWENENQPEQATVVVLGWFIRVRF